MQNLLNIDKFYHWNLIKSKLKIENNWGTLLLLFESVQWVGFYEGDLIFLDLCCKKYWIQNSFCLYKFNKISKSKFN